MNSKIPKIIHVRKREAKKKIGPIAFNISNYSKVYVITKKVVTKKVPQKSVFESLL